MESGVRFPYGLPTKLFLKYMKKKAYARIIDKIVENI